MPHRLSYAHIESVTSTMADLSVASITNASYSTNPGCLADIRMGATTNGKACQTCKQHHHNCPGHYGSMQLPYPVVNPLFVGLLVAVLQLVCVNCQRLRISPHYIQNRFFFHQGEPDSSFVSPAWPSGPSIEIHQCHVCTTGSMSILCCIQNIIIQMNF